MNRQTTRVETTDAAVFLLLLLYYEYFISLVREYLYLSGGGGGVSFSICLYDVKSQLFPVSLAKRAARIRDSIHIQ